MTEEVKPVEAVKETAPALTAAEIATIVATAVKEAMKPAVTETAPVTETPAPVKAETVEEAANRIFEARKAEIVAAVVKEQGLPTRAGFVANPDGNAKPLHEMSSSELTKASREVAGALLGQTRLGVIYPGINRNND